MKKTPKRIRWWRIGVWALAGLALGMATHQLGIAIFVGIVFAFARFIGELSRPKPAQDTTTPPLTSKMAMHYQASGLDDSEISLFRETMDEVADQIQSFEDITNRVPQLKRIALNTDIVDVLHAYFKAIVENPKQMGAAGHFIYEQLPNLVRIANKYEAISHHEVKTADTYAVLTTAANTTADLANAIRDDYAHFVETDIDDLEADINLAKKQLPESTVAPGQHVDLSGLKEKEHVQ
ncbi:5-bromo-4-chloroindolyl phosphate hydrolysis family protein [Lacticaseibacillus baoqingensis]|uniref:5-bromo-4-chloroindolyl phosphate hydrolysis family protein n=1 Tax=Lacticaseibacillus baoqingensis TaxID=2486013 RepID=A0ABW4E5I5_9LACO|nr:5-bromo-4-chloroindolyl phosphate hydrolysis family protein [Lacticaseibacillus baoqingensis]